jgi:hypothetical protein
MKSFSAKGQAENTTFNKVDLEQLERILTEKVEDGLKISKITMYFTEASVEMHSFTNLKDAELEDFEENPRRIRIIAVGYDANRKISKFVDVDLWRVSAEFSVHGSDQKWVLGLKEQLQRFVKAKTKLDYFIFLHVTIWLVSTSTVLPGTNAFIDGRNSTALGFFLLWIGGAFLATWLAFWNGFRRPSRIYLKQKSASRVNWHLAVGIAGLLLTAVGVAIAYMTYVQGE